MGGGFEEGFNAVGDMSAAFPKGIDPTGVQMPGDPAHEQGFTIEPGMDGMATTDAIPVANDFGVLGGDGPANTAAGVSSNAGFRIITSFNQIYPGYTGTTDLGSEGEQNDDNTTTRG
jgi:hypothetical protein